MVLKAFKTLINWTADITNNPSLTLCSAIVLHTNYIIYWPSFYLVIFLYMEYFIIYLQQALFSYHRKSCILSNIEYYWLLSVYIPLRKVNKKSPSIAIVLYQAHNLNHNIHTSIRNKVYLIFTYCYLICTRRAFWQERLSWTEYSWQCCFKLLGTLISSGWTFWSNQNGQYRKCKKISLNKFIC